MPLYEYACNDCREKSSILVRSFSQEVKAVCSKCGSGNMRRLVSRVAYKRSSISHLEANPDVPDRPGLDYYKDPRNIGRWAEKKFSDMGVDMPPQAKEMIDRARDGDTSFLADKGL